MPSGFWAATLGGLAASGIGYRWERDGVSRLGCVRSCRVDHRGSGDGHLVVSACREVKEQPASHLELTTVGHGS